MSERFEKICFECFGPLSRSILVNNILANSSYYILKTFSLTPIEKIILKCANALIDGKTSFILLCIIALRQKIRLNDIELLYLKFTELENYLLPKV